MHAVAPHWIRNESFHRHVEWMPSCACPRATRSARRGLFFCHTHLMSSSGKQKNQSHERAHGLYRSARPSETTNPTHGKANGCQLDCAYLPSCLQSDGDTDSTIDCFPLYFFLLPPVRLLLTLSADSADLRAEETASRK